MKKQVKQNKKVFFLTVLMLLFTGYYACVNKNQESKDESSLYSEKYRSQFHFTPPSQWMNDPNGMVYYEGEYHLFYQHYPDSNVWGPMHWGHAVSTDMIHWEHLPIALYPDSLGFIFSGSAVVDWKNTTGFGTEDNPPLVAIYTYHSIKGEYAGSNDFQYQGIAFSLDKGRTWTKYKNNPVLSNPGIRDFRDPKVSWNKKLQKWIMVLAAHDRVKFYSSENLRDWMFESDFGMELGAHGGVWECPDLFQIEVEDSEEKAWVLLVSINPGGLHGGSGTQYFVGDFDGNEFKTTQQETLWLDHGCDNYAGVTWSDIPKEDGRHLFLGWMSNWSYAEVVPSKNWRSAMTLSRELVLKREGSKYSLKSIPVKELEQLRETRLVVASQLVSGSIEIKMQDILPNRSEMNFQFKLKNDTQFGLAEEFGITLSNNQGEELKIAVNPADSTAILDRTKAGITAFSDNFAGRYISKYSFDEEIEIRLFVDESSVETFVNKGEMVMTNIVFPTIPYNKVEVYSKNGTVKLQKAEIWSLSSIW